MGLSFHDEASMVDVAGESFCALVLRRTIGIQLTNQFPETGTFQVGKYQPGKKRISETTRMVFDGTVEAMISSLQLMAEWGETYTVKRTNKSIV